MRRNASQSATVATVQVAITASSSVPSVTGAGAGAVRNRCHPPRNCCCSVSIVEEVGIPNVVVYPTSTQTTYAASAITTSPRPTSVDHRRARASAPIAWGRTCGPEHGQDEPTRVEDSAQRQPRRRAQRGEGEGCDDARARCHARFLDWVREERVNTWFQADANGVFDASTTTTELVDVERDWLREHRHHVDAGERTERANDIGPDASEHRDHEVGSPVGGEVLEHDGEPVGGVRPDGRETVDHVVTRIATGAEELARARSRPPPVVGDGRGV